MLASLVEESGNSYTMSQAMALALLCHITTSFSHLIANNNNNNNNNN